jgi:Protein of unknown function (DUF2867)
MRLPKTAHTSRPWRVHEFTEDFEIEDVWALPTPGGPDDFTRVVRLFTPTGEGDRKARSPFPGVVRSLLAVRWTLGALLGWDKPGSGVGGRVRSLRDRLPADLLNALPGPDLRAVPMTMVYQTHDEWAAETANNTVHAVMHIGWVKDDSGDGYHAQMAVLVKPNGRFGKVYMAAIMPFRYTLVYPSLLRWIGHRWQKLAVR